MSRPTPVAPDVRRSGAGRIRLKLLALAAVLLTLWAYAAFLTGRDAADLIRVRALADTLGQPADLLILNLQVERRITAEAMAGAAAAPRAGDGPAAGALPGARDRTDRAAAPVRAFAAGHDLRLLTAGPVRDRAGELVRRLAGLAALRSEVDAGRLDRAGAVAGYDQLIDAAFAVYGPEWSGRESTLAAETRTVLGLARARELLAREDTLLTAALAAGRISAEERRHLAELIANQRYARTTAAAQLPATGRDQHRRLMESPGFAGLLALEDRLLRAGAGDGTAGITPQSWRAAVDPALDGLRELTVAAARGSVERAAPGAALVVARTGIVLGLGLVAVLALLFAWHRTVHRLAAGFDGAPDRPGGLGRPDALDRPDGLGRPDALDRPDGLGRPDALDRPGGFDRPGGLSLAEAPTIRLRPVGAGQPDAGSATGELFLRLTQRNQALLREQLNLLDAMERRERAAEEIADLFRLDHLATRIRRNVEKLVTLAGATPARRWRRPVPLLDVVRGAVAEVPDYHRVLVAPHWPWSLAGPAVTDVVHLLAELIENGLAGASEHTSVRIAGEHGPQGCAVTVVDDGPGLEPAALSEANDLLAHPPPDGPPAGRAGLWAAARLAARCGAQVSLRPGPRGGTAAVVLLPVGLVTAAEPAGAAPASAALAAAAYPQASPAAGAGTGGGLPTRVRRPGVNRPVPRTTDPEPVETPIRNERT